MTVVHGKQMSRSIPCSVFSDKNGKVSTAYYSLTPSRRRVIRFLFLYSFPPQSLLVSFHSGTHGRPLACLRRVTINNRSNGKGCYCYHCPSWSTAWQPRCHRMANRESHDTRTNQMRQVQVCGVGVIVLRVRCESANDRTFFGAHRSKPLRVASPGALDE